MSHKMEAMVAGVQVSESQKTDRQSKESTTGQADQHPKGARLGCACPYSIAGGRICHEKGTNDGIVLVPLCNFVARVEEEVILDDGVETTRAFVISGKLETGEPLPPIRVPASRFNGLGWVTDLWGLRAVPRAGSTVRDQLREAIQRLSPDARRRQVFTHTGWREINGAWRYLTSNGAVGRENDFEVDLGSGLGRYRLPRTADDPASAMRISLRLLQIAPAEVAVPLWAGVYRAPLASAFPLDLSLWFEGLTGSLKSTLAALFLCHFGDFDRTTLPGNWSSTANQLERRAFVLKDIPFVIDDYAPTVVDARELEMKAARLLRAQGNLSGRGRLRSDLSERPEYPPRGLIISTGEQHPPGQSILARTLLSEVDRNAIDLTALTMAQKVAGRLAHAMSGYIAWLAPQIPVLPSLLRETFEGTRHRAAAGREHLRVPEALAQLWLGLHCGLIYAEEIGACSHQEAEYHRDRCWNALLDAGRTQGRLVESEQPTKRFLRTLQTLTIQHRVALLPKDETWGPSHSDAPLIGWYDPEYLYLMSEAAFQAVARFCRDTGEPFSIREDRLKRDLDRERVSQCDAGRHTATVKIGGRTRRVLRLRRRAIEDLLGEELETPLPVVTPVTGGGA